ncbi:hypothetical protein EV426DRAFT_64988 [Tirmania nivea]|nr:hypothetical protein EV426DRAFT_64988 [Tirmania nivea]
MSRPFEGKCMHCVVDKQSCTFDYHNPVQCTWCARHRYRCSETELDPRRRKLSSFKCDHCREKHHKCLPETRKWPQRCNFCKERDLPCSPPRSRRNRSSVSLPPAPNPRLSVSPGRSPSLPDGSDSPENADATGELLSPGREHHTREGNNSLDHDLLHPPFLGLMDLILDPDAAGHQMASPLQQHPITPGPSENSPILVPSVPAEFRIQVTPASVESLDSNGQVLLHPSSCDPRTFSRSLDLLELSVPTKRRLIHFLYAADQPLTLTQFSIIPAINTSTRVFETDNILPLAQETAQDYLTCWFGQLITFDSTQKTVRICDQGRRQPARERSRWFVEKSSGLFVSSEEAHAEALHVCTTYLLLPSGGLDSTHVGGMGFQYSDENDLSSIMKQLRAGLRRRDTGFDDPTLLSPGPEERSDSSANRDREFELCPFYSLLEYAALNWPRHLVAITPLLYTAKRVSHGISLSALRTVSLVLSFQFLTWLENLNSILCGNNQHNSEAIALAQAYVFGTFKRWVKASSLRVENPTDVKLFSRAFQWLNILQSVNILGQVQEVSQSSRGSFSSSQKGKSAICHELHTKFATLGSFEEVPQSECDLILHMKFDPDYWKYMMRLINGCREPCIIDLTHRIAFYVAQQTWSGGALQLECVDLETGLILGRDSIWTKRFFGWKQRVIIAKSATHLALQVVAEKRNSEQVQNLLITYVWPIRDMGSLRLGQGILEEGWKVDDELNTFMPRETGIVNYDLYQQGQLQFGSDGITVQTPHGTWDLRTKTKLGVHTLRPTLLAVSGNGYIEAHSEWDARTNSCSNLFLKNCTSQTTCQLLPNIFQPQQMKYHTSINSPAAIASNSTIFRIRYAAFNHSGTKFLVQAELTSGSATIGKELRWFVWKNEGGSVWELKTERCTHDHEFWPLLSHDAILEDIGTICSVHQAVEGAFI